MIARITQSQKQQLKMLADTGLTPKMVAAKLQISITQVYNHWPLLRRRWTTQEIQTLRELWQNANERKLRKALQPRSWRAIRSKAFELGLPSGIPQGHLSIMAASDKYGVSEHLLLKIAKKAGVQICRRYRDGEHAGKRPFMYVEWDEIRDALDAHYELVSVHQAARICGLDHKKMQRKLLAIGLTRPAQGIWRVSLEIAKKAASLETTGQARKRLGLTKHHMRKLITKAGLRGGRRLELLPEQWDRILNNGK